MSSSSIIRPRGLHQGKVLVGLMAMDASAQGAAGRLYSITRGLATVSGAQAQMLASMPQVEDVRGKAEAEAESTLEQARREAEEIHARAYEKGYQKGRADGLASAKTEALADVRRISELARNAAVDIAAIYRSSEEGIVELALSIAEKVVHKRLAEDRTLVLSMVKGAMEQLDATHVLRVRVNPEDLAYLQPYWDEGQASTGGRNIELAADPHVQVGGCVIDTSSSVVDAQIETELAEIDKAFRTELGARAR
ncbi:MAG: FliH/SctL family protein [Bacteroidetes bacterium]|nr:FliH/SctL family protein [Bacteroidota bacterium]MCL5025237.1 FliH/SctL family protein [Chloroflexota bacterium]